MNDMQVALRPPQSNPATTLVPKTMEQAMQLAEMMASAKMLPVHLRGDIGTCFMVIEQAMRWEMSPFAVAACTSNIGGKLMFEGKLVAAAAVSSGSVIGEFDYEFRKGSRFPDTLEVTCSAMRASDGKVKEIVLAWKDAKTTNQFWTKQPEQQLSYAAVRVWCRMWSPGAMLGVYAPEEFDARGSGPFAGPTIEAEVVDRTASAFSRQTPEVEPDKNFVSRARDALLTIYEPADWLNALVEFSEECPTIQDLSELKGIEAVRNAEKNAPKAVKDRIQACWRAAVERLSPRTETPATPPAEPKKRGRPAKAAETPHDPETGEIIPPTGKPPYDEAEQKAASEREMAASAGQTTEVEIWPVDDIGEPLEDQHEPMDAVAFANWFAARLFLCAADSRDALIQHNADNLAEAGDVPEARGVIQGALDRHNRGKAPADLPATGAEVTHKPPPVTQANSQPARKPVALPKTPKGAPHWPNYQEACTVEINALVDDDDADDWFKVNLPTFNGRASQIMVENRLNKKRATFVQANNHELFPPTDEMIINDIAVAVGKMTTTDEIREWAQGPIKAVMFALKNRNPEAHVRASAIVDERWIELSPSDGNE
jgi:hypothetical protein